MENFIIPGLDPTTSFEISSNKAKKLNSNYTSLNEAAERFEALFLSQMLKSARAAKLSEDVLGNNATETYYAMMDNELAEKLSNHSGEIAVPLTVIDSSPVPSPLVRQYAYSPSKNVACEPQLLLLTVGFFVLSDDLFGFKS